MSENMNKKKLVSSIIGLMIIYLFAGWYYPYSWISFYHSYQINLDNIASKEFKISFKAAKKVVNENEHDQVSHVVSIFYENMDDTFITNSSKQTISKNELMALSLTIKEQKDSFMRLYISPYVELSLEARQNLMNIVLKLENTENELETLLNGSLIDRNSVDIILKNLFVDLSFTCNLADVFVSRHLEENK
jgi:hypothetical protein